MKKKIALALTITTIFLGLAQSPASASALCGPSGSSPFFNVGRVDLSGSPVTNTRGLAADIEVYNMYLKPVISASNWSWTPLYIWNNSDTDDYIEYGVWRERFVSGYGDPTVKVIWYNDGLKSYHDIGVFSSGYHRLKFWNNNLDNNKWYFQVDGVTQWTMPAFDSFVSGRGYAAVERTDECNTGYGEFIDTWRYSGTNLAWFELGDYSVVWHDMSACCGGDNNSHFNSQTTAADYWYTYCVAPEGCTKSS